MPVTPPRTPRRHIPWTRETVIGIVPNRTAWTVNKETGAMEALQTKGNEGSTRVEVGTVIGGESFVNLISEHEHPAVDTSIVQLDAVQATVLRDMLTVALRGMGGQ